jgi:hypothetical protein
MRTRAKDAFRTSRALCAIAAALVPLTAVAQTSGTFKVNDKEFAIAHAYAYDFPFEFPSLDGGEPEKLRVLALSDKPFDAAALDRVCQPDVDLDLRALDGAVVLNVLYGARDGGVRSLKYRVPGMDSFANTGLETDDGKFTLEKTEDGAVRGRLAIAGNAKMHAFDPEHIPLVTGDVKFDAKAPVSRDVKGEPLPAGGGDPGKTYLEFNASIGKDRKAPLAFLRGPMAQAIGEVPEDAPPPFEEIKLGSPKIERGTSDGQRARLRVSGKGPEGPRTSEVCMLLDGGRWVIDGFLPAK